MVPGSRRVLPAIVAGLASALLLGGCNAAPQQGTEAGAHPAATAAAVTPPKITITPADQAQAVPLDAPVVVSTDTGTLTSVTAQETGAPDVLGQLSADGRSWRLGDGLDPQATYTIVATASNNAGQATAHASFSTLAAQDRLITSVIPDDGSTVGVGEPITLRFNTPIPDDKKAGVLSRVIISSTPGVVGAWHWYSDSVVHFRTVTYWPSGTKVTITGNLKGFDAGNGVWGLGDWTSSFTVGPKHVSIIDDKTDMMQVYENDKLIATWPVSLGKPGYETISGTLIVLYKQYDVKMKSCDTFHTAAACVPGGSEYYNEDVYYDTAISTNGYFIHAAPWSVYAQGHYDVSHGCVNLSTPRAIAFYNMSIPGDVVVIENTINTADWHNGEQDWQTPFAQYANTPNGDPSVWTGPPKDAPAHATIS